MHSWQWLGIVACLGQSALFSGANLAFFSLSLLRLEVEAAEGDSEAIRVLAVRRDPHRLLATILWGNVAVNCLLTILADSLLGGVTAFAVSTLAITFVGEILPQAYFSRHALRVAACLVPFLRGYQLLLYPIAGPTGWLLDRMLGPESIAPWREGAMRRLIHHHMTRQDSEVGAIEGLGAINFLDLDDLAIGELGMQIEPGSVLALPIRDGRPVLPPFRASARDPFLRSVAAPSVKWVILTDPQGEPLLALDSHRFLRGVLFEGARFDPHQCVHAPIVVRDPATPLGAVLDRLRARGRSIGSDVVDEDLIVLWGPDHKVVTGADLLGRLTRGIARPSGGRPRLPGGHFARAA